MGTSADLDVNRGVRRVLVKHWIDLGRMSVRSTNGRVVLYGRLQRLHGAQGELTGRLIETIFYELKRIPGAHNVAAHFENWSNDQGFWRECEGSVRTDSAVPEQAGTERAPGPTVTLGPSGGSSTP